MADLAPLQDLARLRRSSTACCTTATVNIRGNSYRMREHQDLLRSGSEEASR